MIELFTLNLILSMDSIGMKSWLGMIRKQSKLLRNNLDFLRMIDNLIEKNYFELLWMDDVIIRNEFDLLGGIYRNCREMMLICSEWQTIDKWIFWNNPGLMLNQSEFCGFFRTCDLLIEGNHSEKLRIDNRTIRNEIDSFYWFNWNERLIWNDANESWFFIPRNQQDTIIRFIWINTDSIFHQVCFAIVESNLNSDYSLDFRFSL